MLKGFGYLYLISLKESYNKKKEPIPWWLDMFLDYSWILSGYWNRVVWKRVEIGVGERYKSVIYKRRF